MRADVDSLLNRMGRKEFRYREFSDSFADMELWPIFEAVLTDERVVGKQRTRLEEREAEVRSARAQDAKPAARPGAAVTSLFGQYGQSQQTAADRPRDNLRDFLGQLSQTNKGQAG